jgi:hypothetical protein
LVAVPANMMQSGDPIRGRDQISVQVGLQLFGNGPKFALTR